MTLDASGGSGDSPGATGGLGDSGDDDAARRRFRGALDCSLRAELLRTDGDLGLLWGNSSDSESQSNANFIIAGCPFLGQHAPLTPLQPHDDSPQPFL